MSAVCLPLILERAIEYPISKFEDEGIGYRGEERGGRSFEFWVLSFELGEGKIAIEIGIGVGVGIGVWTRGFIGFLGYWIFRVGCWALMSFTHSTPIPITAAARSGARHALRGCGKRVASLPKIDFRVQMKRLSGIMPGFKTNSGAHLARLGVWRKRNKGHAREVSVSGN